MILATLDTAGDIAHRMAISVNALMLTVAAEARQDMARERGADWAAGAVTFFGRDILK
ncbi:hypothetical protein [Xanthomonas oryzae]|uniref:hypothetical protein n=1 Tax=Xanthomonas oryzae TaxID=347 RepID=UPI000A7E1790|nr:hypothetical protein [Xanthomonas oryzae]